MDNTELREKMSESIRTRKSIDAPSNFVSVYHSTQEKFIPSIDQFGLVPGIESGIGGNEMMQKRNILIDKFRTPNQIAKGLSRKNIYGYPYLDRGNGFSDTASGRFIPKSTEDLTSIYKGAQRNHKDYLDSLRREWDTHSLEEFLSMWKNPEFLRHEFPGEVLEIKVDPKKCYVGDMEYITRIADDILYGFTEEEAVGVQACAYWGGLISLEDFLHWYKKPVGYQDSGDEDLEYSWSQGSIALRKGAPKGMASHFTTPEILVPDFVPQSLLRVLH